MHLLALATLPFLLQVSNLIYCIALYSGKVPITIASLCRLSLCVNSSKENMLINPFLFNHCPLPYYGMALFELHIIQ